MATIRNPIEWGWAQLKDTAHALGSASRAVAGALEHREAASPVVRRIEVADLRAVVAKGVEDFGAYRTDVLFVGLIYPVIGLVLARLAFGYDMLPLVFPLASGFTLVGPVAAVGLYEMSRRREQGAPINWADAFRVVRSPAFGGIAVLGLLLLAIFLAWLLAAMLIYDATLGPAPPASISAFAHDLFTTAAGWTLILVGVGVGFVFAVLVLTISVVSFPLLLDRPVGVGAAIETSVQAVLENPVPMATWGLIVAGGLVLGSIPLFLGLIVVMPVLGHATWHLYRAVVER
jgi:uncharacterized membrane protein